MQTDETKPNTVALQNDRRTTGKQRKKSDDYNSIEPPIDRTNRRIVQPKLLLWSANSSSLSITHSIRWLLLAMATACTRDHRQTLTRPIAPTQANSYTLQNRSIVSFFLFVSLLLLLFVHSLLFLLQFFLVAVLILCETQSANQIGVLSIGWWSFCTLGPLSDDRSRIFNSKFAHIHTYSWQRSRSNLNSIHDPCTHRPIKIQIEILRFTS